MDWKRNDGRDALKSAARPAALARTVRRDPGLRTRSLRANGYGRDRFGPALGEEQRAKPRTHLVLAAHLKGVDSDAIHFTNRQRSYDPNTHFWPGERFT